MTDKLIDNEIVKALECFMHKVKEKCDLCDYKNSEVCDICICNFYKKALDLINRLQAENERLEEDSKRLKKVQMQLDDMCKMHHVIKSEARKEFAERVCTEIKSALENNCKVRAERMCNTELYADDPFISYCNGKIDCLRGIEDFTVNLLKEMESQKNGN